MRVSRDRAAIPAFLKVIITIAALAGISFAVALVWQNAQDSTVAYASSGNKGSADISIAEVSNKPVDEDILPRIEAGSSTSSKTAPESDSEPAKSESSQQSSKDESSSTSAEPAAENYARAAVEGALAPSALVEYSYFDDAIFFGDSISTGIPLYMKTMVPNAAVIATQGISPGGANTSQCIDVNGSKLTMIEAAKTKGERKKVYIMLGSNALDLDETPFIDGYKTFVQSVKELYPEAVIYIQSMLPVTTAVNNVYPSKNVNNQRIFDYNNSIRALAREQGVYYVDVAQCMVNENGELPIEASPYDGMHLTPEYYIKWFDYLRAHTVKDKK